jgi:hypothetical protein
MSLAVRPAAIGLLLCTAYDLGSSILWAKGMGWDAALADRGHYLSPNQEVANGCFGTVEAHVGSSDDA